jgi:hypothetical protein
MWDQADWRNDERMGLIHRVGADLGRGWPGHHNWISFRGSRHRGGRGVDVPTIPDGHATVALVYMPEDVQA